MGRAGWKSAAVVAFLWAGGAVAEETRLSAAPVAVPVTQPRNALSLEPLAATSGTLRGGYERVLTPRLSAIVATELALFGKAGATSQSGVDEGIATSTFGLGVGPGVQYYFTGAAPEGLWAGARLNFLYELKSFSQQVTGQGLPEGGLEAHAFGGTFSYGAAASLGYTATFGSGFLLQLGGELGVMRKSQPSAEVTEQVEGGVVVEQTQLTTTEFALRPRIGLGYAF